MARHIHSRLKIMGELIAESPLHVGGYGESFETDMALARNGKNDFYIPGTSLTGTLRNWFEQTFIDKSNKKKEEDSRKLINEVWGYQDGNNGNASFVLIEDLTLPEQVQSELRDGVGIDRFYGTAADKVKFDRAILPKGTKLNFEMTVEIQNDAGKIKAMFGHLLEATSNGNIRLGAAKTRGLGRVKFDLNKIEEYSLDSFDRILDLVEKKPVTTHQIQDLINADVATEPSGSQLLTISIKWKPKSALMVKAGYEGIGVDMLPLTSSNGKDQVSLCLPGSSIKGAFRAHAERIMRTLLDSENAEIHTKGEDFHKQIKLGVIDELFGAKKETAEDDDSDEEKSRKEYLGLGALSIDDCYMKKPFDAEVWSEVETGEMKDDATYKTQPLWKALKKVDADSKDDTTNFKISHHVAIDRWTGGAAEGALFSVLQPTSAITWDDLRLTLDLSRFSKVAGLPNGSLQKKCLMLLLLVLRDFAENRLALGFATNRGMGEVIVEKIEGLKVIPKLIGLEGESFEAEIKDETLTFQGDKVKEELRKVWAYE